MLNFISWLKEFKARVKSYMVEKQIIKKEENIGLTEEIKRAHQQWLEAQNYFDNVSDPNLIDHASYRIQAARTKYMYLLNKLKNKRR